MRKGFPILVLICASLLVFSAVAFAQDSRPFNPAKTLRVDLEP